MAYISRVPTSSSRRRQSAASRCPTKKSRQEDSLRTRIRHTIEDRNHFINMAYRHHQKSVRELYDEHFAMEREREMEMERELEREMAIPRRVVNIVERRSTMPRHPMEFDRGFHDDQWYGVSRNYVDARECHGEASFPSHDVGYYDDNPNDHFRRNPPQNDGPYPSYGRDDLRHQLGSRKNGRGPHYRSRGRGSGGPRRNSPPVATKRDRSPARREVQPHVRSGSNTSNRSFSPEREGGYTYQQAQQRHKSSASTTSHTPSSSVEDAPSSSGSAKKKPPASAAETEEVAAASMEPKPTPEEDFKARRTEAIKAKAEEIETHYRTDCETFRTVVKMLVSKEPSLDNLLQVSLDKNLLEIKERCLDALRHFVKELDEVLKQPDTSE